MQTEYKSRCSSHALKEVFASLNEAQVKAVTEMGFGEILNINASNALQNVLMAS